MFSLELLVWNSRSSIHCPSFHDLRPAFGPGAFLKAGSLMDNTDDDLRKILSSTKVIALIGWSPDADRPSHRVAAYLVAQGYQVIPVNPAQAGKVALGNTVRASLSEITESVDMVEIFRRSENVGPIVDEALRVLPKLKTIWMQLGVEDAVAASRARDAGVQVVMNRCPAIEIPRLRL